MLKKVKMAIALKVVAADPAAQEAQMGSGTAGAGEGAPAAS